MAHYVIFTKVVTLTLTFIRFQKKLIFGSFLNQIHHIQKIRIDRSSGVACTSRTDGQTDKQTNRQTDKQTDRQTNRGDQYTLQKSTILQSNKPR